MTRLLLTICLFFCSIALMAENQIGIIKSTGDFTFVRNGQGEEFKVIDTLFNGDFFNFDNMEKSEWVKVTSWQGKQIEGFINKSAFQVVENLDKKQQKEIILDVLSQFYILANKLNLSIKSNDSKNLEVDSNELKYFSESKYETILEFIPKFFCSTNDTDIIPILLSGMWANKGSASETPAFSIGECFICNPNLIIQQVIKIENEEEKLLICDNIEWGILNHFKVGEDEKSENKEYNKLMKLLEEARKK